VTLAQGRTRKLRAVFDVANLQRLLANSHIDMLPVDGSLLGVVCVCLLAYSTSDANSACIQCTYGTQYTCSPPLWVLAGYGSLLGPCWVWCVSACWHTAPVILTVPSYCIQHARSPQGDKIAGMHVCYCSTWAERLYPNHPPLALPLPTRPPKLCLFYSTWPSCAHVELSLKLFNALV